MKDLDLKELIRLQKKIKFEIAKKRGSKKANEEAEVEALGRFGSKTTRAEREAISSHIEKLDQEIKAKQKRPEPEEKKVNLFKMGHIVELLHSIRTRGNVQHVACKAALPSIRLCTKSKCEHKNKQFVWVLWPDDKIIAYHFSCLRLMTEDDLKPKIGRELSGKIGPWTYNNETKLWKKDGEEKEYTAEEFADVMYYETHEFAKDENQAFIKAIMTRFAR